MNLLETYAKHVAELRGLWHMGAIRDLRMYINNTPESDILYQIQHINDPDLLRTLIEAGVNETLQKAVVARVDEIQKRMRGELSP